MSRIIIWHGRQLPLPGKRHKTVANMPRAATRLLLLAFVIFAAISFSSFKYGDTGAALPKFQTHAGAYLPKKKHKTKVEDALEFKARKGSFEDVRNATLGVNKTTIRCDWEGRIYAES